MLVCDLGCGHQTWTCLVLSASELRNNPVCQMDRKGSGEPLIISGSGADGGGRVVVLEMMPYGDLQAS